MEKDEKIEKEIKKLNLIKNLHISETIIGIGSAITLTGYQPINELGYFVAIPAGVLCGIMFYHGISAQHKDKEKINDLKTKMIIKGLEN